jgi:DNA-binding CsgD family transcriptional regulator
MDSYWDHFDRVLHAVSLEELQQLSSQYAHKIGFKNHGYAVKLLGTGNVDQPNYRFFHDFDSEWGARYRVLAQPAVERTDARILHARTGLPGNAWNVRGELGGLTRPNIARLGRKQAQLAGEFGMTAGLTLPSWSPGVSWAFMTLATDATHDLRELAPLVAPSTYFVICVQAAIDRLLNKADWRPRLSVRECEVLRWSAIGKTAWEISVILRISERTVNFHLQQAAAKLRVRGKCAACARAVAFGLISL